MGTQYTVLQSFVFVLRSGGGVCFVPGYYTTIPDRPHVEHGDTE